MIKVLIGVIVVTIAVIAAFLVLDPNIGITSTDAPVTEVATNTFSVSIEGEIFIAGKYTMNQGATMGDLINTAGGLTNNADERAFYESTLLTNGMTYYIASKYDSTDLCNMSEVEKANVNNDTAETLATVNGITSTIANSIVTHRTEHGLFSSLEQLMEVYGIGNATYRKIRNYVILHA